MHTMRKKLPHGFSEGKKGVEYARKKSIFKKWITTTRGYRDQWKRTERRQRDYKD